MHGMLSVVFTPHILAFVLPCRGEDFLFLAWRDIVFAYLRRFWSLYCLPSIGFLGMTQPPIRCVIKGAGPSIHLLQSLCEHFLELSCMTLIAFKYVQKLHDLPGTDQRDILSSY